MNIEVCRNGIYHVYKNKRVVVKSLIQISELKNSTIGWKWMSDGGKRNSCSIHSFTGEQLAISRRANTYDI
jgi:hypothetical protein